MAYEEEPGFHIEIHDIMGEWTPEASLGVDRFVGYLRCTVTRLDEFVEESHICELYVYWTQPTPPYYRHRGRCSSSDGSDGSDGDSEDSERTLTAPIYPIPLEESLESLEELHLWEEEEPKEQKDEENDLPEISSQGSCC